MTPAGTHTIRFTTVLAYIPCSSIGLIPSSRGTLRSITSTSSALTKLVPNGMRTCTSPTLGCSPPPKR